MNPTLAILLSLALFAGSPDKERLRVEYDDLAAEAQTLIETVDQMKANLQQQGHVLHPDIASARNHLAAAMDHATEALEKQEWSQLRKHLDRARGWVERLRRKL